MKKVFTILLVLAIAFTAFANGNSESGSKKQYGGSLVIYSPNSDALVEAAYTFGELYGVEVEVLSMGTGEVAQRVQAEAGNPQADVWYGGVNFANGNLYKDFFEPYVAAGNDKLPVPYQNQNGCVTRYCLDGSGCLIVNTEVLSKLGIDPNYFEGYQDLLDPRLKGYIAMGNAAASSSAWAELTNMLAVMGKEPYDEKAWQFVEKFCAQLEGKILGSSSAIYKNTASGEYAVGVSYEDPCITLLDNGAKNVKVVYPAEGAVWLPAGAAIIKGAKNMDNAKHFMDWLISDEGQTEVGKSNARPVNPAINNASANMIPMSEINVAYEDLQLCGDNKAAWCDRFSAIVQKYSK